MQSETLQRLCASLPSTHCPCRLVIQAERQRTPIMRPSVAEMATQRRCGCGLTLPSSPTRASSRCCTFICIDMPFCGCMLWRRLSIVSTVRLLLVHSSVGTSIKPHSHKMWLLYALCRCSLRSMTPWRAVASPRTSLQSGAIGQPSLNLGAWATHARGFHARCNNACHAWGSHAVQLLHRQTIPYCR